MVSVYRKAGITLYLGDYLDVLDGARFDALITDPPYSMRTHLGALSTTGEGGVSQYEAWAPCDAAELVEWAHDRCTGWIVVHTDHVLAAHVERQAAILDRYAFPPRWVHQHQPRVSGDGPAEPGHYLSVSRPREARFCRWGSLPGMYIARRDGTHIRGGKPLELMRAIVRDYTQPRPGEDPNQTDMVCDPCAGAGTTLLAAALEGREAIGAEVDEAQWERACKRIEAHAITPPLRFGGTKMRQEDLL